MKAEYRKGCLQRDSVERKGYAGVPSVRARDNRERDNATQDLLREILWGKNLLEAMKCATGNGKRKRICGKGLPIRSRSRLIQVFRYAEP